MMFDSSQDEMDFGDLPLRTTSGFIDNTHLRSNITPGDEARKDVDLRMIEWYFYPEYADRSLFRGAHQ